METNLWRVHKGWMYSVKERIYLSLLVTGWTAVIEVTVIKVLHGVVQVEKLVYIQNRSHYFRRAQSPHAFFFRPNCSFTVVMWQY